MFTVSGPISSSTYFTSEYFGFFVPVLAHRGRCTLAPRAASAFHRGDEKISPKRPYASRALATASFPISDSAVSAFGEPGHRSTADSRSGSTAVSTRETKNDATDATLRGSPPPSRSRSRPRRYASATAAYRFTEKISVTFTGTPEAIVSSTAGSPSFVPGILIITFGRPTASNSSRARAIVAFVSRARSGSTSRDTYPSSPFAASYTGRSTSAAARMSSVTIRWYAARRGAPSFASAAICSS